MYPTFYDDFYGAVPKLRLDGDAWMVFALALLLQWLAWEPGINIYDEGIILSGADAVYSGLLPYRDFWTMVAPGQFYLTALLFHLFEPQEYLVRCIGLVSKAAIAMLAWVMMRRFLGKLPAALGAAALLLTLTIIHYEAFPVYPATACAMLALLLMERGICLVRRRPLFLAGLCTALAACFRHDLGFYTAVALAAGATALWRMQHPQDSWLDIGKNLGAYAAGILLVGVPVAAFFLVKVPLHDLVENLIRIPATGYTHTRRLEWPGFGTFGQFLSEIQQGGSVFHSSIGYAFAFSVYIPFIIAISALAAAVIGLRRNKRDKLGAAPAAPFLLLASILCLLLAIKGLVRVNPVHMVQSLALAVPIALIFMRHLQPLPWATKALACAPAAVACALMVLMGTAGALDVYYGTRELFSENNFFTRCKNPVSPRLRCVKAISPETERYALLAHFLQQNTAPHETVYVGAGRHDRIEQNGVLLYFMAARLPATKWAALHPGVQTSADIQQRMIEDMRRMPPRFLVLDSAWDENAADAPEGARLLDEWLAECHAEAARIETVRILAPRADEGGRCGSPAP
ncbi:MAG: glycosyltransferase family 39 protein [Ottowia sp.]|nr:glycosyltransferase family 39 protein [Ottowia sp.]